MPAESRFAGRKLAIFLPSLEAGGAESVMASLANAFAARQVVVDLLLARASGHNLGRLDKSVRVKALGGAGVTRALPGLVRFIRQSRSETLLSVMTHANIVAAAAAACARRPGPRLVLSERMSLMARARFYASPKERIVKGAMPLAYRKASRIIVPAHAMIEPLASYLRLPPQRFVVIGNPVMDAAFAERAAQPWPLGEIIRATGGRLILAVGRLTRVKGYEALIAAFAPLAGSRDAHLVILGEGEERGRLERAVEAHGLAGRIHMPGFEANPLAAMSQADVFVLSSYFEGLPNVLIQALACGVRVVSTDCPTGPREILEDGRWGRLVDVGNISGLTAAMEEALDFPVWPDGRARAQDFTEDFAVSAYLDVLFPEGAA